MHPAPTDIADDAHLRIVRLEERLRVVERARRVTAECNRLLVRATEESELLREMCRIVIESGGYRMAWIGLVRHDEARTIEPVASAGDHDGYLALINPSWADNERGQGPAACAVRERVPQTVRHIVRDARFVRYRKEALARGYLAVAALPLIHGGEVLGVLTMFSAESNAFDTEEVALLEDLAQDIAYGMRNLRLRLAEQHAEEKIEDSQRRFRATFDAAPVGINHIAPDGRILFANARMEQILGYAPGELSGKNIRDLAFPEDAEATAALWVQRQRLYAGELNSISLDRRYRHKDGSEVWVNLTIALLRDAKGDAQNDISVMEDVTARRRAEALLRLEHWVARSLADAESVGDGLTAVMRAICETQNWQVGRYFAADKAAGLLRFETGWSVPALSQVIRDSRGAAFEKGAGLIGKAWETGTPMWSTDARSDPRIQSKGFAIKAGLHGVFTLPVMSESETFGVFAFASTQVREPDQRLLQAARLIASQVGQFLQRKQAEENLRRFRIAMDHSADMIVLIDRATMRFIDVNDTICRLLGYTREELLGMGPHDITPASRAELERVYDRCIADPSSSEGMRSVYRCKDGSIIPFESTRQVLRSGDTYIIAAISRDIRERIAAEQALRERNDRSRLIAEFGQQALAGGDLSDILAQATELVARTLMADCCDVLELEADKQALVFRAAAGRPAEWIGQQKVKVTPGGLAAHTLDKQEPLIVENYATDTRFKPSLVLQHGAKSGLQVPIHMSNGIYGLLGVHTLTARSFTEDDVSFVRSIANILAVVIERKSAEDRMAQLAQFDAVTGLPNRYLFRDRLSQALAVAARNQWQVGVMFVDLDRFKAVNDTYGHAIGDKLLYEVAVRLKNCVRASDVVGRLSGDEFTIVLANLAKVEDAGVVAQKLIAVLAQPFDLNGHHTYISASIGIALYPSDGADPDTLIKNADTAMYRAKEQGRNGYQFYLPEMNARLVERLKLEAQLRGALVREEFLLHYQPKVRLDTGAVSGLEALLRWKNGDKLVSPAEFIPILEDTGLIVPVGEWVLHHACAQLKAWQRQGIAPPPIAVNLSARQFRQRDLPAMVGRILRETGIAPELIEFELTETLLMTDAEDAVQMLNELKALGVRLSVDDFGTGYSSLTYLKRFPLDALKIDRAFIRDATTDADDATIAITIINLAHSLKLKVVAEGVETEGQLSFLRNHGCDEMQGFYFARPSDAAECTRALIEGRRLRGPEAGHAPGAPALLLVDDDPPDLELLSRAFAAEGFRVLTADSPQAGFDLLARNGIDVVVSDQRMPEMSGIDFLRGVKRLYPNTVRIVASGCSDLETVTDAVNSAGIHKFLSKDWNAERLRAEVRAAYQQRG